MWRWSIVSKAVLRSKTHKWRVVGNEENTDLLRRDVKSDSSKVNFGVGVDTWQYKEYSLHKHKQQVKHLFEESLKEGREDNFQSRMWACG